jgi:hypothetical protein
MENVNNLTHSQQEDSYMIQKPSMKSSILNTNEYKCYQIIIWLTEKGKAYPRVIYSYAKSKKMVQDMIINHFPRNKGVLIREVNSPP